MMGVGGNEGSTNQCCHLRVGCALLAKKVARYLTPRMLETAAANGIELVQIDLARSLLQQGAFNVIIHKLRPNADWEHMLQEYKQAHPDVVIIDRLDRIKALHNRATMLTPLSGQGITLLPPEQEPSPTSAESDGLYSSQHEQQQIMHPHICLQPELSSLHQQPSAAAAKSSPLSQQQQMHRQPDPQQDCGSPSCQQKPSTVVSQQKLQQLQHQQDSSNSKSQQEPSTVIGAQHHGAGAGQQQLQQELHLQQESSNPVPQQHPIPSPQQGLNPVHSPSPQQGLNPVHSPQPQLSVRIQAPLQVEIPEGATESEAQAALAAAGLSPPLLCKPLWTDGREGSHGLAVLHDLEALGRLLRGAVSSEFKPPLVVQQFVEHGGVLFKVYVLGSQTVVTARPSLGETVLEAEQGVQQLPRISCISVFSKQEQQQQQGQQQLRQEQVDAQPQPQQQQLGGGGPAAAAAAWQPPAPATALCPPDWVTAALAATLRQELGMQLFNFDLIVPEQQQQQQEPVEQQQQQVPPLLYVVDINYFPGVDKLPDFEQRFVTFLKAAAAEAGCGAAGQQQQGVLQQQQQPEVLNLVQQPLLPWTQLQQQRHTLSDSGAVYLSPPAAPAAAAAAAAATLADKVPLDAAAVAAACRQLRHSWSSGSSSSGKSAGSTRNCAASSSSEYDSPAAADLQQQQGFDHRVQHAAARHHHHHHHHHNTGLEGAGCLLGSSPPQLQVAGCS